MKTLRAIAATNRDLAALVKQGKFREDLFYRVNAVRIDLPPLRRRKVDIPALAERFVAKFNRLQRKEVEGFSSEALAALMSHDWPGNIRELGVDKTTFYRAAKRLGLELPSGDGRRRK